MSNNIFFYFHDDCLLHKPGNDHPENPQRLKKILAVMRDAFPNSDQWIAARKGVKNDVLLAHDLAYFDKVETLTAQINDDQTYLKLDEDTVISKYSMHSALYGVGAACHAVDDVVSGSAKQAFCLTRPPGHHAVKHSSMGFCIFGNAAIAAKYALTKENIEKVAIIDFDVHQGNGTEDLVKDNANILMISIHENESWPYEHHDDHGPCQNIYNYSVPAKSPAQIYHDLFDDKIIPLLNDQSPDLVIISAGFDAHRDDPPPGDALFNDPPGRQNLLESDFAIFAKKLKKVAQAHANGKLVAILEGGYNPDILAKSCVAFAQALDED